MYIVVGKQNTRCNQITLQLAYLYKTDKQTQKGVWGKVMTRTIMGEEKF